MNRTQALYRAYLAASALAHRTHGGRATAHYHRADRYLAAYERARVADALMRADYSSLEGRILARPVSYGQWPHGSPTGRLPRRVTS
jgi:hypothetical protein